MYRLTEEHKDRYIGLCRKVKVPDFIVRNRDEYGKLPSGDYLPDLSHLFEDFFDDPSGYGFGGNWWKNKDGNNV